MATKKSSARKAGVTKKTPARKKAATKKKATAKKKVAKKAPAKKTAAKKTAAKKTAKKTAAKKTAKKTAAKKTAKKTAAKKTAKKTTAKKKAAAKGKAKAAKRAATRKKTTTKTAAKKAPAKKAPAKKAPAKTAAKKAPAKTVAKKAPAKTAAKKTVAKKAPAKKTEARRPPLTNPVKELPITKSPARRTVPGTSNGASIATAPTTEAPARAPASRRLVWVDLMTPSPTAAMAFYAEVLGHTVKDLDMGTTTYHQISASGEDIGGILHFAEEGVPAHWLPYVDVDDVDAVCERARSLGGQVHQEPWDIPGVGRTAVIASPDGAVIAPIAFTEAMPPHPEMPAPGQVAWTELFTQDLDGAARFYETLFGWTSAPMDLGDGAPYRVFSAGETQVAGAMASREGARSAWLTYFAVDDVDATVEKAQARSAQLVAAPEDVPDIGRFAILRDPEGAMFAIHTPPEAMTSA